MKKATGNYPVYDCRETGHAYDTYIVAVGNKHVYDFAGKIRVCGGCGKTKIHVTGVWVDAPKQERKKIKAVPVDENQMSLFE